MPSPTEITIAQLARFIGLPGAPALVDVRADAEFQIDPRIIPTAQRRGSHDVARWSKHYVSQTVIVVCERLAKRRPHGCGTKVSMRKPSKEATQPGPRKASFWFETREFLNATQKAAPCG
jgi:hypothetical protein